MTQDKNQGFDDPDPPSHEASAIEIARYKENVQLYCNEIVHILSHSDLHGKAMWLEFTTSFRTPTLCHMSNRDVFALMVLLMNRGVHVKRSPGFSRRRALIDLLQHQSFKNLELDEDSSGYLGYSEHNKPKLVILKREDKLSCRHRQGIYNSSRLQGGMRDWSDANGWNDACHRDTIKLVRFDSSLFLIGRSSKGVQLYKLEKERWLFVDVVQGVLKSKYAWKAKEYYSTIQYAPTSKTLYIIARGINGMFISNLSGNTIASISSCDIEWTDDLQWNKHQYYSTIQSAVVSDHLFVIGRSMTGILIFQVDGNKVACIDQMINWSDQNGWNAIEYYSTIQTAVIGNKLYLIGRSEHGIVMYELLLSERGGFSEILCVSENDILTHSQSWSKPEYYSTIKSVVVQGRLYIVARGAKQFFIYRFNDVGRNHGKQRWTRIHNNIQWTDAFQWNKEELYCTIKALNHNGKLLLCARSSHTIHTEEYNVIENAWTSHSIELDRLDVRETERRKGHYPTVQYASHVGVLYIVLRDASGIVTYVQEAENVN